MPPKSKARLSGEAAWWAERLSDNEPAPADTRSGSFPVADLSPEFCWGLNKVKNRRVVHRHLR